MTRRPGLVILVAVVLGLPLSGYATPGGQASSPQPADLENAVRAYRAHLPATP
jgi:hypothetical protein